MTQLRRAAMNADTSTGPAKPVARLGWGLLVLALATPLILGAAGILPAFKVGEFTVQVGFAWLAAAVVIDLILRKRDAVIKANGRIVASTLALVMALSVSFTWYRDTQKVDTAKKELIEQFMKSTVEAKTGGPSPAAPEASAAALTSNPPAAIPATATTPTKTSAVGSEADRTVAVLQGMKSRVKKLAEDFAALDRKFTDNDLGSVLKAENLVTHEAIQASRRKVETFKTLIAERNTILKQHFVSSESLIRNSGLTEREMNDGLAGLNSGKDNTLRNYENLGVAQLSSLRLIGDLLTFADNSVGRTSVKDGQMMFQTQPELDEYRRLLAAIGESAAREEIATKKVQEMAQGQKQSLVDEYRK
jgi:hypothetical protein